MKKLLALVLLTFTFTSAQAAVTCTRYGNTTTCSGYDSSGNYVSYSCTTYGNQTTCS